MEAPQMASKSKVALGLRGACTTITILGLALGGTGQAAHVRVDTDDSCGLEPPDPHHPIAPPPAKAAPSDLVFTAPVVTRDSQAGPRDASSGRFFTSDRPAGILSGKTVYLSPGHGFTWEGGGWNTQRGTTNSIVEDLVSAEAVDQFLAEYLRRMGAYVVTVREGDTNPALVIVDDSAATLAGGASFAAGTDPGYGGLPGPVLDDSTNPFATGTARRLTTHVEPSGELTYLTPVPTSGYYTVYISYRQAADHAPDAHFVVRHAGGTSSFRVDQRRHGTTWVRLGSFWFDAGADPAHAAIAALDDSASPGTVVSVDAVRLGGGMSPYDRGGGLSGRPMWEMCSRYFAQLAGAPSSVWETGGDDHTDDVSTRSRFAAWDHEAGEDAVYLAWHTNATGTSEQAHGTESYTYGPDAPPGPLSHFSGTAGSLELQAAVHDELVGDLRKVIDPGWVDRGKFTAYFGEVNPSHNDEMPAVLVEVGFHDGVDDAAQIEKPEFRRVASRALAQGIARYFAGKDGVPLTLPPEPPVALTFTAGHLAWRAAVQDAAAGDTATAYRVYLSADGLAFDDGHAVTSGTSYDVAGLAPGQGVYARVTATNAGGESLDSITVGSRLPEAEGQGTMLVVNGFTSLAPEQLIDDDLSAWRLGTVRRMWLWRMNDFSYVARHGQAIASAGGAFDSAGADAIDAGDLLRAAYPALDWFRGGQVGPLFSAATRDQLASYVADGGRILVSGANVASTLAAGDVADQAFLAGTLHAVMADDDVDSTRASGGEGSDLDVDLDLADPARDAYALRAPDGLAAGADATFAFLTYDASSVAGLDWGTLGGPVDQSRGVVLGFPFETIAGAGARAQVMAWVLAHFELDEHVDPPPMPRDQVTGCGCSVGSAPRSSWGGLLLILGLATFMLRRRK
jgi:MYXO-CTERM domain-containing protein